jgi:hypothetical protein
VLRELIACRLRGALSLLAVELVGLGQQHMQRHAGRGHESQQAQIGFGQPQARIGQQNQPDQRPALGQILGEKQLPALFVGFGHRRIAVARQIDQQSAG